VSLIWILAKVDQRSKLCTVTKTVLFWGGRTFEDRSVGHPQVWCLFGPARSLEIVEEPEENQRETEPVAWTSTIDTDFAPPSRTTC